MNLGKYSQYGLTTALLFVILANQILMRPATILERILLGISGFLLWIVIGFIVSKIKKK